MAESTENVLPAGSEEEIVLTGEAGEENGAGSGKDASSSEEKKQVDVFPEKIPAVPEPAHGAAVPPAPGLGTEASPSAAAAPLPPPDDFDVICSNERDLLGNFLVRDLVFHHGTRNDGGGGGVKSVDDIADRIVSTVRRGIAYAVAGDGRYPGGRFLVRVEDGSAYRELDADEAKAYIAKVFQEAFPQYVASHQPPTPNEQVERDKAEENVNGESREKEDEEKKNDGGDAPDGVPSLAKTTDVLLLNGSLPYPEEEVYAVHPGNKRFVDFLDGASCGLESSGLDSSTGAATARAQLFISSVDFVRGSVNNGRFLAQKARGGEWAVLDDELAVWETITVLLWRKYLERERQKLLSPPPPPPPPPEPVDRKIEQPAVSLPAAAASAVAAHPAEASLTSPSHGYSPPKRSTVRSRESSRWPADYHVIPPSDQPIARPTDHDVLFGRGGLTNHHPRNKRFRDIIAVHRADYVEAIKIEKPNVARKIVRAIRCGIPAGRFLKKNGKDGMWYDVGDRHAAEKASQALREKSQAEKYEKIALKKQAEAAIRGSKIAKGTAPFGAMAMMPPLASGLSHPAGVPGQAIMPYPPPPPGHPIYGVAPPNPGVLPPVAPAGATIESSTDNKRKSSAKEAGKDAKKPKTSSSDSSSTEVYTPIDQYGDIIVTDHDILCGRGGLTNHHLGNKRFRDLVSLHRPDYIRAPKIEKPAVARMIVSAIRNGNPPGRFLKKDHVTGKWFDIGDKRAAEKASQALREKTPEERLKLAAKHDRPMPTRQYFSSNGTSEELPFASPEGAGAKAECKEEKEEAAPPTQGSTSKTLHLNSEEEVVEAV